MRIAESADGKGLNDDGTPEAMESIRAAVTSFRNSLEQDPKLASDLLCRKMARQIDKYGDKLFAEPILVDTPSGKVTIYPQRTNNIMEQFFRQLRRGFRRKSGNNTMRKTLQTMLADTPLVKNLDNPDYMEILLNGKTSLEELFADMDMNRSTKLLPLTNDADSILPGFRKLIQLPSLPERVVSWLKGQRLAGESN